VVALARGAVTACVLRCPTRCERPTQNSTPQLGHGVAAPALLAFASMVAASCNKCVCCDASLPLGGMAPVGGQKHVADLLSSVQLYKDGGSTLLVHATALALPDLTFEAPLAMPREELDDPRMVGNTVGHAVDPARRAALVDRQRAERVRCSASCPVGTSSVVVPRCRLFKVMVWDLRTGSECVDLECKDRCFTLKTLTSCSR
jgi:hypothetical protein